MPPTKDNPDEPARSGRPRKPTEKGKLYAEARGGANKNSSKTPEKATTTPTASKEKKTTKKKDKGKARAAPSAKDKSTNGAHKHQDEFRIQTLPANRTSDKANTIDLRVHARSLPRSSGSLQTTSVSKTSEKPRQSLSASASTGSRRLSKEMAAKLAAMKNPYVSYSRHGSPGGERTLPSLPHAGRSSQPSSRSHGDNVDTHEYAMYSQASQKSRASFAGPSTNPTDEGSPPPPHHDPEMLREYNVSTSRRLQNFGQLPMSHANHAYGRDSQYNSNTMFEYSDHPRARAQALAYAPEHAQSYQGDVTGGRVRNCDASALFDDDGYKTPYDNHSNRHGSPPPHTSSGDDVAGAWSPEAHGDHSGHAQGTRRRQPSEISYDENSAPHQGPAQRRRTTSPPYAEGSSSPPRVGSDGDHNDEDEDNNEEEGDEDEADLSCPDFPKVQRLTVSARSKQGDYDEEAQEAMALAVVHFKSMVMSEHAYPGKLTDKIWATTAWYQAVEQLHIELAPNQDVLKLIARYSWILRGELKVVAQGYVPGYYGFRPLVDPATQDYNRQLAATLSRNRTFTYQTINKGSDDHEGLYEAPVIQMIINRVFYKHASDDGVLLHDIYHPFPLKGLALVLAAIQCAIDEWNSGVNRAVAFTENDYSAIYERHIHSNGHFETWSRHIQVVRLRWQTTSSAHTTWLLRTHVCHFAHRRDVHAALHALSCRTMRVQCPRLMPPLSPPIVIRLCLAPPYTHGQLRGLAQRPCCTWHRAGSCGCDVCGVQVLQDNSVRSARDIVPDRARAMAAASSGIPVVLGLHLGLGDLLPTRVCIFTNVSGASQVTTASAPPLLAPRSLVTEVVAACDKGVSQSPLRRARSQVTVDPAAPPHRLRPVTPKPAAANV
ncbi:hypothetical protein VTO73DRAFT_13860 [Trametes versicolor]